MTYYRHGEALLEKGSLLPLLFGFVGVGAFFHISWFVFRVPQKRRRGLKICVFMGAFIGITLTLIVTFAGSYILNEGFAHPGGLLRLILYAFATLIGYSEEILGSENTNMLLLCFAYIFGVGMVEEFAKYAALGNGDDLPYNEQAFAGFYTGVGFGLGESLAYSFRDYNGEVDWTMYLVRFVSLTSLHGFWTGAASLVPGMINMADAPKGTDGRAAVALPVVIVLHGLYDAYVMHQTLLSGFVFACLSLVFFWFIYLLRVRMDTKL